MLKLKKEVSKVKRSMDCLVFKFLALFAHLLVLPMRLGLRAAGPGTLGEGRDSELCSGGGDVRPPRSSLRNMDETGTSLLEGSGLK